MEFTQSILADPRVFQLGRLPAHSSHIFRFGNGEACHLSLDGRWAFRWAPDASQPFTPWDEINVPGHIQLQGGPGHPYGVPQYVNCQYPWDGHEDIRPGQLPTQNPVGEYRRTFTVPPTWQNCRICFEGADSAVALWCNEQFIGYSESSFDAAEFDLTPALCPGENTLRVQVYRYSSGSWLEDQDFWRMSGLFRSVSLVTAPLTHIEDIRMDTRFTPDFKQADVTFTCKVSGKMEGNIGLSFAGVLDEQPVTETVVLHALVDMPHLWSAEDPFLYDAAFVVHGADDGMVEIAGFKAGLRQFGIQDGLLQLNGKRIVFKGVNRHEWSANGGRSVTREETEWDIRNLKRHNVNAVRTCHYPDRKFFYDLCDKYGLYVIDETNLETHGSWLRNGREVMDENALPGSLPQWRDAVLARGAAMLERDKNHPCVLFWSCGNESAGGETLHALHDYFRQTDPSRPVHYEGIFHDRTYPDTSDVESQMYTPAAQVEAFITAHPEKPFILCEYGHAMGNSCGELEAYTELARRQPLYQGGFLWEYMDHGLRVTKPNGIQTLACGGDFGDRPTDGIFCMDGLVSAERDNTPKMQAVRAVYAPFTVDVTAQEITICNENLFTDLAAYEITYTLARDGHVQETAATKAALAPGETLSLPLPFAIPAGRGCFTLEADIVLAADTLWARAGHVVACGQAVFEQGGPVSAGNGADNLAQVQLVQGDNNIGIKGNGFSYLIDRATGRITSVCLKGHEVLDAPVQLEFWRAPTSNDLGWEMPYHFAQWAQAGRYAKLQSLEARQAGAEAQAAVEVDAEYLLAMPGHPAVQAAYLFDARGRCTVSLTWQGEPCQMPAFGLCLPLDVRYQNLEFFGRGPADTMPDRQAGALLGSWRTGVQDGAELCLPPQEYATHTGVRIAMLSGRDLPPLRFEAPGNGMMFAATPWTPQELENAGRCYRLPPVTRTVARCLLSEMGAGGDDSWGALPHEEYRFAVNTGSTFTFRFGL